MIVKRARHDLRSAGNAKSGDKSPHSIESARAITGLIILWVIHAFAGPSYGGILLLPTYRMPDNAAAVANPNIEGAIVNVYWSQVAKREGEYDWTEIDRRTKPWLAGGKKVALRIMWSSSGMWPDPLAKHPTPQWVVDKGAVVVVATRSQTQVPVAWDPIYRRYAGDFLKEIARKFDGDPNILFIDVTPGAETNPYRFGMNAAQPGFKQIFLKAVASDGRSYSDDLWLKTVKSDIDRATALFCKTKLLATLNVGSLGGPSQLITIGDYCVAKGCFVGQNGLTGKSYLDDSPRRRAFLRWGSQTWIYQEAFDPTGPNTGSLMDLMKAAERVHCSYLGAYGVDILKATRGQPGYDATYAAALAYGAKAIGNRASGH
jgi:hypothetical protein